MQKWTWKHSLAGLVLLAMFVFDVYAIGFHDWSISTSAPIENSSGMDVDKILVAKDYLMSNVINYPDTANFHDLKTRVSGDTVTLVVTSKNAFGVPETRTLSVKVVNGKVVQ